MKVALFTETYLPNINGVVTHVHSLRMGLEKLGHEVLVVCADSNYKTHTVKNGVLYCPGHKSSKFYGFTLAKPWGQERKRLVAEFAPDVIHVHQEFGIGYSGVKIARALNIPWVYTLHTMYDDYVHYVAPKPFVGLVRATSHGYIGGYIKKCTAMTGPSKKCQEYVEKIGLQKAVTVVPNPVELDLFDPAKLTQGAKDEVLAKLNLPADTIIASFVGRLGKEKSADLLLEYWAKTVKASDGFHLLIIGDGPEKPTLEALALALGIADQITFTGSVPHGQLLPYYGVCSLYVTASLSDTNSISMLEGMATGLPVLQRLDRLNEDQVVEGQNGFVFDSPESLKAKLEIIKNLSPEAKEKLSYQVRQSVVSKGCEVLAANLLKVYGYAVGKNKPFKILKHKIRISRREC